MSAYDRARLMSVDYDSTDLAIEADNWIRTFQADSARERQYFPSPDHTAHLPHRGAVHRQPGQEYFGEQGMLGYERRTAPGNSPGHRLYQHQNMAGSDIGDDHKEYFAGEAARSKAGVKDNTMNQFGECPACASAACTKNERRAG